MPKRLVLNELFVPLLQRQYPEITDFYLPAEGCSYRMVVVSIKKAYPGHARRVMFGIWSFLRQFMYYPSSSWWSMTTSTRVTGPT